MSFFEDVISKDARLTSVESVRDPALLEPGMRQCVERIIAGAAARGITLVVTETFRSKERQQHLFTTGATHLREVGVHHYGLACDFAKIVDGKASWSGDWSFLGQLARENGLIWGGDWGTPDKPHSFRDMDHVQRCAMGDQDRLFAGAWFPDAEYDPTGTGSERVRDA